MLQIKIKIITPEKIVNETKSSQITLPTTSGQITILPNHIPLVSLLAPGEIRMKSSKGETVMACSGGYIEFRENELKILADSADHLHELDEQKIEQAKKKAEELLKQKDKDAVDFASLTAGLEREMARLKVLRKHRGKRSRLSASQLNRPEVEAGNL